MTRTTHIITAGAVAMMGGWVLYHLPVADRAPFALWTARAAPFAAGSMLGAIAPDWLELATFSDWFDRRMSVIPHRTITHWPWPWLAALGTVVVFLPTFTEYPDRELIWGALGFVVAAILHLLLDMMTPTGIPLGFNPFGKRTALAHIHNGSPAEILVSMITWVIALAVVDVIKHAT